MSKKMMLLALTVVSAALFALPAVASAQEIEIDPGAGTNFTVNGPAGSLAAAGEPTINCSATGGTGSFTSKSTGTLTLDFTGCKVTILGFPIACNSAGGPSGTVATSNVFHTITINNKPGVLVTPPFPTLICGSTAIQVKGNGVIGTITKPGCNEENLESTIKFEAEAGKQKHMLYTGVNYDLSSLTHTVEGAKEATGALVGEATIKSTGAKFKVTCQ